jgi:tetratricopeptide (TPR) repeat protein/glutaredoxin 2
MFLRGFMTSKTTSMINYRYILHEQLGAGGMGVVYRATDRLTGECVALKRVIAEPEKLQFASKSENDDFRLALAKEFKLLASVRHPDVVSVLDYGFDEQQQPYFTMELLNDPEPITKVGSDKSFRLQFILMVQLTQALAYLHRRGIIHRDLKPENVMVVSSHVEEKTRLQVKILDFGLAVEQGTNTSDIAGTLAYMAPEVLRGTGVTEASDVYALGLIAYELYSGIYPYNRNDVPTLITEILTKIPDFASLNVDDASRLLIQRMLSKDPEDRYPDAMVTALAYADMTGYEMETTTTRESYLQAARLVGREQELNQLNQAFDRMVEDLQGGMWLLAGESGIGKSRLLDEIATLAMVRGVKVLRGQAVSEAGALYNIWRSVVRHLCLFTPLSDTDAAILKMLVPDIEDLIGRSLPETPSISNPQLVREQLIRAISTIFYAQQQPLVVILEDLHWESESLDIIVQLQEQLDTLPLLIIGSYRDDERPNLPKILPQSQFLKLHRFDKDSIANFSEAILGEVGKAPHVIELLEQETEGNLFFIVEVIRALAEEAGQFNKIGKVTLPAHVFTGGVQQIVRRRLEKIPLHSRPLLSLVAIAGRELDLSLLAALAPSQDLTRWLSECEAAAVIEVHESKWRFAHDKLREAILSDLSVEERQKLHQHIAESMEYLYADRAEYIPALAYHWKMAQVPDKIIHYADMAGDQAIQSGVNREARLYFIDALNALSEQTTSQEHQRRQIDITTKLARASAYFSDELVHNRLNEALKIAQDLQDELRQVKVLASQGGYYYTIGRMKEALACFNECIPQGERLPDAGDVLMTPYIMLGRTLAFTGDAPLAIKLFEKGIALVEKYNDPEMLSGALSVYACVLSHQGRFTESQVAAERSLQIAAELGNPARLATNLVWILSGAMDGGQFEVAMGYSEQLFKFSAKIKDQMPVFIGNGHTGLLLLADGQIELSRQHLDRALTLARQTNFVLALPQYMAARAVIMAYDGERTDSVLLMEQAFEVETKSYQSMSTSELHTQAARMYHLLGDFEAAYHYAEQALAKSKSLWHKANAQFELLRLQIALGKKQEAALFASTLEAEYKQKGLDWHVKKLKALQANH